MSDEYQGTSFLQWLIGGGALTAILAWMGNMQRQLMKVARDASQDDDTNRQATAAEIADVRKRVTDNESAIVQIKEQMVSKDDLERGVCRIEAGVTELGRELRSSIQDTHRRVDKLYEHGRGSE